MSGILTTARLVFKDPNARRKAIDAFRKIIAYTTPEEPEVLQYICAVPVDDTSQTEIYMIEEYANQAASDAHLATQPVQDLIQLFTTGDVLAQPPEVHNCPIVKKNFYGPPLPLASGPAIALLDIASKSGQTVEIWKTLDLNDVISIGMLSVAEDKEASSVRAEVVLKSWDAFSELQQSSVGWKMGEAGIVKIKPIDGFVGRDDKSKL